MLEEAVFIIPCVVFLSDDSTQLRHGWLRRFAVPPVAVGNHSVLPNPEPKERTLPQSNPEWTGNISEIKMLCDGFSVMLVPNPQQACVFFFTVVEGSFPSITFIDSYDSHGA